MEIAARAPSPIGRLADSTMSPRQYVELLSSMEFEDVFNPYSNCCAVHDLPDAPLRRRNALVAILEAAVSAEIDSLWLGRDLGYRGGRRTGLALTDDLHIAAHATRWGVVVERSTRGAPLGERTAHIIWDALAHVSATVFLWNVFPFHPHQHERPLTNRAHNPKERHAGENLLRELIRLLSPRKLIALGNDAAQIAARFCNSCEVLHLRHPSYGGQRTFRRQILDLYKLPVWW